MSAWLIWPPSHVGRPAGERLGHASHEQQIRGTGEKEAAVAARPVLVDHALHGEQQIGLALDFVQGQPRRAPNQVPRGQPGPLMDLRIVEGEVEAVGQEGLGPREGALAGLTRPHQHDDGKGVEGALQQAGRMARQIRNIDHCIGDYRLWRGQ